jgi:hypothetical protein
MKRLIIVCEGPTEQEFCSSVLMQHLMKFDIVVSAPLVKKSNGGIVSWTSLRQQILKHLHERDAIVSMLVDYYGLKDNFMFPGWEESKSIVDKKMRMHYLFERMKEDVPEEMRNRFIPYIQLHEFEGLLFSDINAFRDNFGDNEADFDKIENTIHHFPNPEDINNNPLTAPSKRLIDAIPGYNKIVYGNILAERIGLDSIRRKCPLFNEWVNELENL